jgi:hypothetical protein
MNMKMNWKHLKSHLVKGTFLLSVFALPLLSSCDNSNSGTNTDGGGPDTETDAGSDMSGSDTEMDSGITTDTTSTGTSGTDTTGTGGTQ